MMAVSAAALGNAKNRRRPEPFGADHELQCDFGLRPLS
jgi:hypothetical protein